MSDVYVIGSANDDGPLSVRLGVLSPGHVTVLKQNDVTVVIRDDQIDLYPRDGWHLQTLRDGVEYPRELPGPARPYVRSPKISDDWTFCPLCGRELYVFTKECPHCGNVKKQLEPPE